MKATGNDANVSGVAVKAAKQARKKKTTYANAMRDALAFKPMALPDDFRPLTREEANKRTNIG